MPDRARGGLFVRPLDVVDGDPAGHRVGHHQQHAGHRRTDAELHHGLTPIRRDHERAHDEDEREQDEEQRDELHRFGDIGERRAEAADVALDELHPLG
jgi:hypothetical protein